MKIQNTKYTVRFETMLNASMRIDVWAYDFNEAIKIVLKEFPDAYNFS